MGMSVTIGRPAQVETLWFYKNTVQIEYNDVDHVYCLVKDGQRIELESVTQVLKVVDKSDRLVPWSSKVAMEKLLRNVPTFTTKDGRSMVSGMPYEVFLTLAMDAKSAHKDKLEDAASIGKVAHSYIEAHIKHELGRIQVMPPKPEEPRAASCCNAALDWMRAHNIRWLQTERKIYSWEYEYTGTMDGLCYCDSCEDRTCCQVEFKDRLSLADWKTSNYLSDTYVLQVAAYSRAWSEEFKYEIDDRWVIRLGKEDGKFETWHLEKATEDRDFQGFITCLELTRTLRDLKARIQEAGEAKRERDRAAKREEKKAAHLLACPKSKKYKGSRRTTCIDGIMCVECERKFKERNVGA
jgi:hypothetical protein